MTRHLAESIQKTISTLHDPAGVVELRMLSEHDPAEIYRLAASDTDDISRAVVAANGRKNIFLNLNPIKRDCETESAVTDADIACRSWFFIDVDTDKAAGCCATEEQCFRKGLFVCRILA